MLRCIRCVAQKQTSPSPPPSPPLPSPPPTSPSPPRRTATPPLCQGVQGWQNACDLDPPLPPSLTPYLSISERCPITLDTPNFTCGNQFYDSYELRKYLFSTGQRLFPHNGSRISDDNLRLIDRTCGYNTGPLLDFFESGRAQRVLRSNELAANEEKLDDLLEHDIRDAIEMNDYERALMCACELSSRNPERSNAVCRELNLSL